MKNEQTYRFSKEEELFHQTILHANNTPAYGLFDGEMGITLVLSEYERARKRRPIKNAINFLLDNILSNLHKNMPLDFANGLTGIGWGVEYLIQKGFQKGVGVEICEAIDAKLMAVNLRRVHDLSLETGIEGWLHYIMAHVQGAQLQRREAFEKGFLAECMDVCHQILLEGKADKALLSLSNKMIHILKGEDTPYSFHLGQFIQEPYSEKALGLHHGISGQLYKMMEGHSL